MSKSIYEEYMDEKNSFILWNDNSTDVDYQPASIIKGGKEFIERLEECLRQYSDKDVLSLQVEPMTGVWGSFEATAQVKCEEDDENEEAEEVRYILLKAAEY